MYILAFQMEKLMTYAGTVNMQVFFYVAFEKNYETYLKGNDIFKAV